MKIAQEILDSIGQPESDRLEYKAVLPPAVTIAQTIGAFANTNGGTIVLGVVAEGNNIVINGLSDEFRAVQITRKAIDLLSPPPTVEYDYVVHQGKRLFVIDVKKSAASLLLGGKVYARTADRTTLQQPGPTRSLRDAGIAKLAKVLEENRKSCTAARAKLLDHCNRSAQGLGWSLTSGRRRARDGTIVDGSTPTGVS